MLQPKPISRDAVPSALAKAERYRLLNEPGEAESICLDVLQIDPSNQDAVVMLILALTDQFPSDTHGVASRAEDLVPRLSDAYDREYYSGIIRERRAKAALHRHAVDAGPAAAQWLHDAMTCFERADALKPAHNDDAVLRWNACARLLQRLPQADLVAHHEPIESE